MHPIVFMQLRTLSKSQLNRTDMWENECMSGAQISRLYNGHLENLNFRFLSLTDCQDIHTHCCTLYVNATFNHPPRQAKCPQDSRNPCLSSMLKRQ